MWRWVLVGQQALEEQWLLVWRQVLLWQQVLALPQVLMLPSQAMALHQVMLHQELVVEPWQRLAAQLWHPWQWTLLVRNQAGA